jgi:hypothetical protein
VPLAGVVFMKVSNSIVEFGHPASISSLHTEFVPGTYSAAVDPETRPPAEAFRAADAGVICRDGVVLC